MGALREWYFARDGVGHANRPRLHDALGLDAQSRRICFPSARRCAESNTNGIAEWNPKRYTYSYGDSHAYSNSDGNRNTDRNTFGNAYRHLPGNLYDSYYHWHHNRGRHRYRQPLRRL